MLYEKLEQVDEEVYVSKGSLTTELYSTPSGDPIDNLDTTRVNEINPTPPGAKMRVTREKLMPDSRGLPKKAQISKYDATLGKNKIVTEKLGSVTMPFDDDDSLV